MAALLASLLPSALRVPLSGPSASAELAPVPGRSDSGQGDLSALGQSSTDGLGSGSGLDGLRGGGRTGGASGRPNDDGGRGGGPSGGGHNPAQKKCVGDPPRQTEDPLSPPCVAYFKGDNGGATAKGVAADEIVAVHEQFGGGECGDDVVYSDYDDPDDVYSLDAYERLLMFFWGIQAVGPKLTPANLDKGLHAIPARRSLDPFTPAAYFAPGNYSFVKDWSAVWWDPAGRPPGTNQVGCWRLVEDGLRYRAEDWQKRLGDEGIQGQNQPCQGESRGEIGEL